MDIKIINKNNEEVYIPLQGLNISEENGIVKIYSSVQLIGFYSIIGPVISLKTILDKINDGFIKRQKEFDLTEYLRLYEEETKNE